MDLRVAEIITSNLTNPTRSCFCLLIRARVRAHPVPGDSHANVSTCSERQSKHVTPARRGGSDLCCVVKCDELCGGEGAECAAPAVPER